MVFAVMFYISLKTLVPPQKKSFVSVYMGMCITSITSKNDRTSLNYNTREENIIFPLFLEIYIQSTNISTQMFPHEAIFLSYTYK